MRNLAPTLAKILCTHLLPSLLYPFHFPTIFIYIVSNIILCIFFYKHLPVSSPTLSLYSPYPFQYHHCILPILSNISLVFSLSFPISVLYSPYPFQYQSCILPILSIPYLYPPYPFQYHPFSSLYVSYHFQYYPCILPHTSIFSYTLYIQVYNIHQSVHNHTPLPPYPFQYHPCILTIYIDPFQYIHIFSQWPFQYQLVWIPILYRYHPCILPISFPISSLYSPYILSNIILVSSLCPSVFSLSFSISSLYRLYLFQYHPCILPILSNIILVSSLSFPISSLYRHSSLSASPCILRGHYQSRIRFRHLLPISFTSLSLYFSQPSPFILANIIFVFSLSLFIFMFTSLLCFSKYILKTTNISISVKGGFLYNYF